jgi:hypothetical protein
MDGSTNSVSTPFDSVRIDNVDPERQADVQLASTKSFEKLQVDRGVSNYDESSTPGQTTRAANQRLAMGCLAGLAMVFSIVSYLLQSSPVRTPESLVRPPIFLTEIPNASNEEWMLLPGVGEKTASTWRNESGPITSLEDLHGVGAIRAEKLKPYVSNVAPHPSKQQVKSKKTKSSSTKAQTKAQATDE